MAFGSSFNTKVSLIAAALVVSPLATAQSGSLEDELFASVRKNDLGGVRATLDAGANVFSTNRLGNRPADIAVDLGHFDIAHYLLSVMDHQRRAKAAQEQPDVAIAEPVSTPAVPKPVEVAAPPPTPQPAPEPPAVQTPSPFDTAAADAIFTPPAAPVPPRKASPETKIADQPAATADVPKILPTKPAPPAPKAAAQPKPVEKPVAQTGASDKPKRTLDDIMRTASKADSVLHVQPATPKTASQSTPKPIGLYAQDAQPKVQPAAFKEESEPQPVAVALKAETPMAVETEKDAAAKKPSVMHVAAVAQSSPAQERPQATPVASIPEPTSVDEAPAAPQAQEETSWFGKMKSYLGMADDGDEGDGDAKASAQPAPTAPPQSAQPVQPAAPVEVASLVPMAATPSANVHAGSQTLRITTELALGKSLAYEDLKAAPCVNKRRRGVVCLETVKWPKDLRPYFADMNSTLYRGSKAVVGYQAQKATFMYAVFSSTDFKSVVAVLTDRFGPPIKSQRGVRPVGEDLQANLVRVWSGTDEATGQPMTLEVALYDDQRGTFPVMHEGALKLTYTGSDSAFRYVEPMELQRFK